MRYSEGTGGSRAKHRRRADTTTKDESYLADAVCRKVLDEEYSRAAALLQSPGLEPLTNDTAEDLQRLLHPRPAPALGPGQHGGVPLPEPWARKVAKRALRTTPRGSGTALGGARWEHWRAVLSSDAAPTAFHELLLRVAAGHVPEHATAAPGLDSLADLYNCDVPLAQHCLDAVAALPAPALASRNDDDDDNEALDWRQLAQEPRTKLQRVLSKRLKQNHHAALLNTLNAENRARLRSCGGPLAAGWQLASPGKLGEPGRHGVRDHSASIAGPGPRGHGRNHVPKPPRRC